MAKSKPSSNDKPSKPAKPARGRSTQNVADVHADDAMLDRLAKGGKANGNSNVEKLLSAWKDDVDKG